MDWKKTTARPDQKHVFTVIYAAFIRCLTAPVFMRNNATIPPITELDSIINMSEADQMFGNYICQSYTTVPVLWYRFIFSKTGKNGIVISISTCFFNCFYGP